MSNVQGKKAGDVWISGKKITCYYETDNKILNIILKHTLHTGPALVEFFGFFFFFMLTPLYTTTAPPRHIHTHTHRHTYTYTHPFWCSLKKNFLLGQTYFLKNTPDMKSWCFQSSRFSIAVLGPLGIRFSIFILL